jgi:hypothetical protein
MSEKLLRVRVYDDDPEMVAVYEAFVCTRENSKSKRGHARRGVESEFVRRLLVTGYRHLYGPFPAPSARVSNAPLPPPSEPTRLSKTTHEPQDPGATETKKDPPRLDMSLLLKGAKPPAQ